MLFPAYAGVIPTVGGKEMSMEAFPRLRGGSTLTTLRKKQIIGLS